MKDIPVWAATFIPQFPVAVSPGHSSGTSQLRHLQDWFFPQTHWERLFLMFLHEKKKKKAASQNQSLDVANLNGLIPKDPETGSSQEWRKKS